jgi:hypothetical protein
MALVELTVPKDWSAVTLEKYLALQRDVKVYGEEQEGNIACLMHHLVGLSPEYINQIDTETFVAIKNDLIGFMATTELPLQRVIEVDGKKYGFEPNLSKMAYGAYLDITKHDTFTIDDNWAKIMAILYRPIKGKVGELYTIDAYTGKESEEPFLKLGMDIHFGALFFFVHLSKVLPNSILKSLTDSANLPHNIKSILEKSGRIIPPLSNWRMETLE